MKLNSRPRPRCSPDPLTLTSVHRHQPSYKGVALCQPLAGDSVEQDTQSSALAVTT